MTRVFKVGDIVDVARPEVQKLVDAYVPGFPDKITSTTGRITSTYFLHKPGVRGGSYVTVALLMCPEVQNLEFDVSVLDLIIPTEVVSHINDLHSRIDGLESVIRQAATA